MKAYVYVSLNKSVLDPQGKTIHGALKKMGYKGLEEVRQGKYFELSLDGDLANLHIASGTLRPLLTSQHVDHMAQPTGALRLSPHSVYVGELYHR